MSLLEKEERERARPYGYFMILALATRQFEKNG
jgi:hypothetical protein